MDVADANFAAERRFKKECELAMEDLGSGESSDSDSTEEAEMETPSAFRDTAGALRALREARATKAARIKAAAEERLKAEAAKYGGVNIGDAEEEG